MRAALTDLYGVDKPLPEQYANFMRRSRPGRPRTVAARLPHAGDDARHAGASLDAVPPDHCGLDHLDMRQPARRTGRVLPEQPSVQGRRGGGDRHPADSLLHRGLSPAVHLRVHLADPADIGRLRHGRPAGLEHRLHPLGRPARHPAGHVADPRRVRHLVPGHARPGLEHRHRGLRDLCRARGRAAQTPGHLLRDAQRRRAAVDRPGPGAGSRLLRHDHHRAGLHLSRHGDAVGRRSQSRRQHHGARGVHGFHHCGSGCDLHRRPPAPPPRPADQDRSSDVRRCPWSLPLQQGVHHWFRSW